MEIRLMKIDDYDEIYKLWLSIPGMGMNTVDDSRDGIERFLKRNPNTCFVAVASEQIIGTIMAGHDGRRGHIYHTAVLPEYRNRGIAKSLVEHMMAAFDAENIQKVSLVAFKDNKLGNGFWEKIGFTSREDLIIRNKNIHYLEQIKT